LANKIKIALKAICLKLSVIHHPYVIKGLYNRVPFFSLNYLCMLENISTNLIFLHCLKSPTHCPSAVCYHFIPVKSSSMADNHDCTTHLMHHPGGKKHLPQPRGPHSVGFLDLMTRGDPHKGSLVRIYYPTKEQCLEEHERWPVWAEDKYISGLLTFMQVLPKRSFKQNKGYFKIYGCRYSTNRCSSNWWRASNRPRPK